MSESKVVRYEPDSSAYGYFLGMRKAEYGDYVTHADYKALEDEIAALRGKVRELVEADTAAKAASDENFPLSKHPGWSNHDPRWEDRDNQWEASRIKLKTANERRRLALEALS